MTTLLSGDVELNPGLGNYVCCWEGCSDVSTSIQMLARHAAGHVSFGRLCQWAGCTYYSTHPDYLQVHVLQHIYRNETYANDFNSIDQWAEQLPSGSYHQIYTDLSLCPPTLRSRLGLLLFDEHFELPFNKPYSSLDHKQYLLKLEAESPKCFYKRVEDYCKKCKEIGLAWEFNSEVWTKGSQRFKRKLTCVSSDQNIVLKPRMDVYVLKQPPNCIMSVSTPRPDLSGYDGNLQLHPCYSEPKRKRRNTVLNVDEPWVEKVCLNLEACHNAIDKEIDMIKDLFAKGFLSAKYDTLIQCEKQVLKLASYPSCSEGVLFFTVLCSADVYYIRCLDAGCYNNIVSHAVIDRLCDYFHFTRDNIFVSYISTEDDIRHETGKLQGRHKRSRGDKILKDNKAILERNLCLLTKSADSCAVSLNYFLHVAGKGCGADKSSDKWFIESNLPATLTKELKNSIIYFPIHQQEESCKNDTSFCEETLSHGSSLFTQSVFLSYLSNDPYHFYNGRLRYSDRFPTSSNPTSLRYRIMQAYKAGNISLILEHLKPIACTSVSTVENADELSPHEMPAILDLDDSDGSIMDAEPDQVVRRKKITREILYESLAGGQVLNCADYSFIYDNYKRRLLQGGVFKIQVFDELKLIAILNDYSDSDGSFLEEDFVYLTRTTTETCMVYTCSCKIYRTLLEGVDNLDQSFDTLDKDSVQCLHCRFFIEDVEPNLTTSTTLSITRLADCVKNALKSVNEEHLLLLTQEKGNLTMKFSVLLHGLPSLVLITYLPSTDKYIIQCTNGLCKSQQGSKHNTVFHCHHLSILKKNPFCREAFSHQEEEVDSHDVDSPNPFDNDTVSDNQPLLEDNEIDFDANSGLWHFKGQSSHLPRNENDECLSKHISIRDTWNDLNSVCIPRQQGCLIGPNLVMDIPPETCTCQCGWTDHAYPHGRTVFDRTIMIYTLHAPVICSILRRQCVNNQSPCEIPWDEGESICVHVSTQDTGAGDEIGWAFVKQVTRSHITFSSFCAYQTDMYKMRNHNSRSFMKPNAFIRWWFSWASNMRIDFRQPCSVCKFTPKQLACDGIKVGIRLGQAADEDMNESNMELCMKTPHTRMNRCFIPDSKSAVKNQILLTCREHLNYLAVCVLGDNEKVDNITEEMLQQRNELTRQNIPEEMCSSFCRFIGLMGTMEEVEKTAYAYLLKIVCRTAPACSLLPLSCVEKLKTLVDHLRTPFVIDPKYYNNAMYELRYYAPEVRDVIATSMCCNNSSLPLDIATLILYLCCHVTSLSYVESDTARVQTATYNPAKYGRAYYFSKSGCKLRNVRRFSIDEVNGKSKTSTSNEHDDSPQKFENCHKYFAKPHVAARGSRTLFLWICPNHGHCYGFHMTHAEGRKDPFSSLYTHLKNPPNDIFCDFACSLQEYSLNRESGYFKNVNFFHDIFYDYAHKCSSAYRSSRLLGYESINSELCEQFNRYIQGIKYSAGQMNQKQFCFYLQFFLHLWNKKKREVICSRLNVALAGAPV